MDKYFIERLTASKPDWDHAILFAKGVEPFGIVAKTTEVRHVGEFLIVKVLGVADPFDPPIPARRTGPNPQDIDMGSLGSICDSEVHMHEEEIVRIEFITNSRKKQEPKAKTTSAPPKILTSEGENQVIAKEREEGAEQHHSGLKSV